MKLPSNRHAAASLLAALLLTVGASATAAEERDYAYASKGVMCFRDECAFKILLDESNFGSRDIEMAELNLPAGYQGEGHPHGSTEIFYVVSGRFGHEVNGKPHMLETGMIGIVKPGDIVRHSVPSDGPARVLVIWLPGGEVDRIFDRKNGTPIE